MISISVFEISLTRGSSGCYRTSNGWFWSETTEEYIEVFVDSNNIGTEDANIIREFINQNKRKDSDKVDYQPQNNYGRFHSKYLTNILISRLPSNKYASVDSDKSLIIFK